MDYISSLRKHVGHAPLIMVAATVFALDEHDRLLMMLRTDNGCWGVPGGAVEPGESVEEAGRRETREETGLEVGRMALIDVFSGPGQFYVYPNGDQVHNVSILYLTRDLRGSIKLDLSEHSRYDWFPLDALPENISPPIRPMLASLAAALVGSSHPD